MSKNKHTPGPWFQEGTAVFSKQNAYYIAETEIKGKSFTKQGDEAEANAALIAAAPEMFEALENNLRLLEAIQRETGYVTLVTQQHLKSILKKARGE